MSEVLSTYSGLILNVGVILLIVIGVLIIGGIVYYYRTQILRYKQYTVTIFERDGMGQTRKLNDKAGIFVDSKTQNKRFYLKRAKVGLETDNIPYITDEKGKKHVYIVRNGLKNFRFLHPQINTMGDMSFTVGEEDVNWAVNAYEAQKKRFSNSLLMQLLPFVIFAFITVIILVMMILLFQKFEVLKEVAVSLQSAANAMAQAQTGTTVITGG